jgi:hypothetical protein
VKFEVAERRLWALMFELSCRRARHSQLRGATAKLQSRAHGNHSRHVTPHLTAHASRLHMYEPRP